MNAYSVIAKIYDSANTDFDYPKYYEFVKKYLSGKVVELGCGSGAFTHYLLKCADSIIAVDSSQEMLDAAMQNHFKNREYIQFVQDEVQKFAPPSKVNAVVSVCDCFNYVSPNDIAGVFEKICGYIKNGGYFIFDISSQNKLENVIGNNIFFEDREQFTYLWTNKLFDDRVQMEIVLFENFGDYYKRADECHTQYIHKQKELENALIKCGFEVQVFDGEKFTSVADDSLRLLFVCRKK